MNKRRAPRRKTGLEGKSDAWLAENGFGKNTPEAQAARSELVERARFIDDPEERRDFHDWLATQQRLLSAR